MPERDTSKGQTVPAVLETGSGSATSPADDALSFAALDQAEADPTKSHALENEPDPEPTASKFDAALVVVAEEKTSVAAGKVTRAKGRKASPRKAPTIASTKRAKTGKPQIAKVKDRRIMANLPSFQKADLPELVADVQDKAMSAFEKSTQIAGKVGDAVKVSADAVVTSGKILGAGFKEIGVSSVVDTRQAIVTLGDDLKEFAAIKTPSDLLRFQGKFAGRNLDAAFALASKNGQTLRELVNKAWAPLSPRTDAKVHAPGKAA